MTNFLMRLLSRKFLLALGTFLVFFANGQYTEAMAVVLGYLGVEGVADAVERKIQPRGLSQLSKADIETLEEDEPDRSRIVSGKIEE